MAEKVFGRTSTKLLSPRNSQQDEIDKRAYNSRHTLTSNHSRRSLLVPEWPRGDPNLLLNADNTNQNYLGHMHSARFITPPVYPTLTDHHESQRLCHKYQYYTRTRSVEGKEYSKTEVVRLYGGSETDGFLPDIPRIRVFGCFFQFRKHLDTPMLRSTKSTGPWRQGVRISLEFTSSS